MTQQHEKTCDNEDASMNVVSQSDANQVQTIQNIIKRVTWNKSSSLLKIDLQNTQTLQLN